MTGIAAIEQAMLARLKAASDQDVLGYRFRTLESYPEEFDDHLKTKVIGDRAFPAAWTVFAGWRRPMDDTATVQVEAVFMLVLAAQNLRNEKSQRHGVPSAGEVGSYQLILDATQLLHGQHLGLDIGRLSVGPCRSVRPTQTITERQLSVFALEFATLLPIEMGRALPAAGIADFSTFHADWDVPPFGNVADVPAPPAGPGAADATDRVELPA